MRFQLPDGSEFELTDKARAQFDADNGKTLLADAERLYQAGQHKQADANCVIIAARATEIRAIAERAIRASNDTFEKAKELSAKHTGTRGTA